MISANGVAAGAEQRYERAARASVPVAGISGAQLPRAGPARGYVTITGAVGGPASGPAASTHLSATWHGQKWPFLIRASGYSDYWPLTVTPQATRPKRSKSLMVTIGALIALSAALTLAFRHGIHAW